ncbi:MAG: GNAT family N-acetyltransferase [Pseudomonadales bacterium]|nr:GNAT family N-acetyltransferase [Pseudomonadales bacterium]NRA17269.1 GNAT family N-acetyltransferase [Oceanospirillaceae bacterium]
MANFESLLLADDPDCASTVAQWYFDQWISQRSDTPLQEVLENVGASVSTLGAPMIVLIKENQQLVAAAQLKIREMKIYPQYQHWLGGVYVRSQNRGMGIAALLVKEVINQAKLANIDTLYLQTEVLSGGIYAMLGFSPLEQVHYEGYDVLVMKCDLSSIEA